jgi:quercetin dioxygenase-like cupin family protein
MLVTCAAEADAKAMEMEGARGVTMRVLLGLEAGAPTFVMRMFEVAPGGHTPMHTHDWEHEVYVLDGMGEVASPEKRLRLEPGAAVLVAPGETHQFVNTGSATLRFLCLIPVQPGPC